MILTHLILEHHYLIPEIFDPYAGLLADPRLRAAIATIFTDQK